LEVKTSGGIDFGTLTCLWIKPNTNGNVFVVVKASLGKGTSVHAIDRIEFDEPIDMSLDKLDQLLLDSGFEYLSKWSREREEYKLNDEVTICLDCSAGYGYAAEFESVVDEGETFNDVKSMLFEVMKEFEVEEASQDRLERMFEYYNQNWSEYYGTDKVFVLE